MDYWKINDEVLYFQGSMVSLDMTTMGFLKAEAFKNQRQRIRLCTHQGVEDKVHEMFIVHTRDAYVRPHKHLNKSESFYLIEGEVDVIFFDEEGHVTKRMEMAASSLGKKFYYRISEPIYHTLLIKSDVLCFLEVTAGPFDPKDTVFPSWAPDGSNPETVKQYMESLRA